MHFRSSQRQSAADSWTAGLLEGECSARTMRGRLCRNAMRNRTSQANLGTVVRLLRLAARSLCQGCCIRAGCIPCYRRLGSAMIMLPCASTRVQIAILPFWRRMKSLTHSSVPVGNSQCRKRTHLLLLLVGFDHGASLCNAFAVYFMQRPVVNLTLFRAGEGALATRTSARGDFSAGMTGGCLQRTLQFIARHEIKAECGGRRRIVGISRIDCGRASPCEGMCEGRSFGG